MQGKTCGAILPHEVWILRWSGGKRKMMDTTYNVGIYCRLSNDDERDGESVSIENQENICQGGFHPKDEIPP